MYRKKILMDYKNKMMEPKKNDWIFPLLPDKPTRHEKLPKKTVENLLTNSESESRKQGR